jgi:hypothetical protein
MNVFPVHQSRFPTLCTIKEQLLQKYGANAIHEDKRHGFSDLTWSDGKKTDFELSAMGLQITLKH